MNFLKFRTNVFTELSILFKTSFIMYSRVSLLICLSPSKNSEKIDELTFFHVCCPFVKVMNIKLIAHSSMPKAFVEVIDRNSADLVVNRLHNKVTPFGKVYAHISNKNRIFYKRSLQDILRACLNMEKPNSPVNIENRVTSSENLYAFSQIKQIKVRKNNINSESIPVCIDVSQLFYQSNSSRISIESDDNDLFVQTQIEQIDSCNFDDVNSFKNLKASDEQIEKNTINVTHQDLFELDSLKVANTFKTFGTIVNLTFDYDQTYWSIEYSNSKDFIKS